MPIVIEKRKKIVMKEIRVNILGELRNCVIEGLVNK